MNPEVITLKEVMNDGSQINLHLNGATGAYAAYGFSAFNLYKVAGQKEIEAVAAYSNEMAMPVVQISAKELAKLTGQSGEAVSLKTDLDIDRAEYRNWVQGLR